MFKQIVVMLPTVSHDCCGFIKMPSFHILVYTEAKGKLERKFPGELEIQIARDIRRMLTKIDALSRDDLELCGRMIRKRMKRVVNKMSALKDPNFVTRAIKFCRWGSKGLWNS
jgi:hypothetical protein